MKLRVEASRQTARTLHATELHAARYLALQAKKLAQLNFQKALSAMKLRVQEYASRSV